MAGWQGGFCLQMAERQAGAREGLGRGRESQPAGVTAHGQVGWESLRGQVQASESGSQHRGRTCTGGLGPGSWVGPPAPQGHIWVPGRRVVCISTPHIVCGAPHPPHQAGPCPSDAQDGILIPGRSLECDKSAERRTLVLEAEFIVEKLLSNYCQL